MVYIPQQPPQQQVGYTAEQAPYVSGNKRVCGSTSCVIAIVLLFVFWPAALCVPMCLVTILMLEKMMFIHVGNGNQRKIIF
jgi:hypothetical protein